VAPRPHGSNTGTITATDWAQSGRFAAGLDQAAAGSEFQRADSAPRDTLGDSVISAADWVQAGRYTALLDPVTQAGGPASPAPESSATADKAVSATTQTSAAAASATIRLNGTSFVPGQANTLTVEMEAGEANVNALGFSLSFDPAHLTFLSAKPSEEAADRGATLTVNSLGASDGRLGLLVGLPPGQIFPVGSRQLVKVTFGVPAQPAVAATQVGFNGRPVVREVVDARAKSLPSNFVASAITFDGRAQTLQFGASIYTASESDGAVQISVKRAGDISSAATVDYATADATASERQDYTTTLGTLRFEAGEATKTVSILIVDDAKAEGEQSFVLTLSNATGGAALGSTDSVEVRIADDDVTDAVANPIDRSEYMIRQHYLDFLNREPDPSGLAFWVQGIESCGADLGCREVKRIDTSAAFFLSIEFQNSGYLAHRLHRAAFSRLPGYREFVRDSQELGRGVVVGAGDWEARIAANKRAFADRWVARAEFRDRYDALSNAQYVDTLFHNAGVTPALAERDALVNGLDVGAQTRAAVLISVAENDSFVRQEFTRGFVFMQYVGYLRRGPADTPDSNLEGFNFWLDKLNKFGGDFRRAEMVRAFIESDEYRGRFGR
jgi:hypothetical protein